MPFFGVPIRNGLPIGLGSVAGFGVQQFDPSQLFEGGTVAGAWYDPSDLSTMFDTSAGTTPVAMPGLGAAVPVGLMLDKSQGLVLGPELVTNGDFSNGTTGWTAPASVSLTVVGGVAKAQTISGVDAPFFGQFVSVVAGTWYEVTFTSISDGTSDPARLFVGAVVGAGVQITPSAFGTYNVKWLATTTGSVAFWAYGTVFALNKYILCDNISVKALPGNHAISFNNTTARPELRARVNLLEYSEQFDNGYWTKSNATVTSNVVAAPNGTTTADKLIENTATDNHFVRPSSFVAGTYTFSCFLRQAERTWAVLSSLDSTVKRTFFDLSLGVLGTVSAGHTATIVPAGNGWYQCTITVNVSAVSNFFYIGIANADNGNSYTGDGTSGIYIWGADLRPANIGANVPAYQRIADALTYDTNGFPLYLRFDGIDDSMYTPANLNLSGTDKVAVFAGVRQTAAGSQQQLVEFSADVNANNGAFSMPKDAVGAAVWTIGLRGTSSTSASSPANYAAPITTVNAGLCDIGLSTDEAKFRINGVQVATSGAGSAGTGNFGTYPLFIGARNNSSLWFNGHLYSLVVAGSAVSAGNISATEQWVAGKTGIQI